MKNEKWVSAKEINALTKNAQKELNRVNNIIEHNAFVAKQYMQFKNDEDLLSQGQEWIVRLQTIINTLNKIQ
jgi:hypothetical protein